MANNLLRVGAKASGTTAKIFPGKIGDTYYAGFDTNSDGTFNPSVDEAYTALEGLLGATGKWSTANGTK